MSERILAVDIPSVAFKGADSTDAKAYLRAAENLERGYPLGGGNLTAAVARLLRNVSAELTAADQTDPEWSFYDYQRNAPAVAE